MRYKLDIEMFHRSPIDSSYTWFAIEINRVDTHLMKKYLYLIVIRCPKWSKKITGITLFNKVIMRDGQWFPDWKKHHE